MPIEREPVELPKLTISSLARHRQHLPVLVTWFEREWPEWYGPGGRGSAKEDLESFASSESMLPIGLVVLARDAPIGIGALKAQSLPSHHHLGPWASAGYVLPAHRGRGIGALLLGALAEHGYRLGFEKVHCATSTAIGLLRRCGWLEVDSTEHEGKPLGIFCKHRTESCH